MLGGLIYLSTNSGSTWNPAPAPRTNWISISSSADGTRLLALGGWASAAGPAYFSTNAGIDWQPTTLPLTYWRSSAVSADGSLFIASGGSTTYVSLDAGTTWTPASSPGGGIVACSGDGGVLVQSTRTIYTSTNIGTTWSASTAPNEPWDCLACSVDGRVLLAEIGPPSTSAIYISTDFGNTWSAHEQQTAAWDAIACSADTRCIAAAYYTGNTGLIYLSSDSGQSWQSGNEISTIWQSLACSADGSRIVAVCTTGIYICQLPQSPMLNIHRSANTLLLDWIVPVSNFVLQQSPAIANPAWTDVTSPPTLLISKLSYQTSIPVPTQCTFFRLVSR